VFSAACRRVLGAALVAGLTAGCGGPEPSRQPADLVIGASLELTGAGGPAGTAADNALHLALDQVNGAGVTIAGRTRKIRLIIRDNASDPDTAGRQARALVDDEKAVALIGGSRVTTAAAIADAAEATKVPALTLSPGDGPVRRYVYAVPPAPADVAKGLAARLNRDRLAPVTVFAVAGPYGDQGANVMPTALRDAGVPVGAVTRFEPSASGLSGPAHEVSAAKPGAAVIWADGPAAGEAASALRTAGYGGQLAFDPGAGGDETLAAANRLAIENGLLVGPGVFDVEGVNPNDPLNLAPQRFTERYTARYGSFSGLAPYGADALGLVVAAIGASSSPTAGHVRDALESTGYDGISGRYAYSATNHSGQLGDRLVVYRCKQGRWTREA
jgi:branched-chain amino acid transport system substrate-binding protein